MDTHLSCGSDGSGLGPVIPFPPSPSPPPRLPSNDGMNSNGAPRRTWTRDRSLSEKSQSLLAKTRLVLRERNNTRCSLPRDSDIETGKLSPRFHALSCETVVPSLSIPTTSDVKSILRSALDGMEEHHRSKTPRASFSASPRASALHTRGQLSSPTQLISQVPCEDEKENDENTSLSSSLSLSFVTQKIFLF